MSHHTFRLPALTRLLISLAIVTLLSGCSTEEPTKNQAQRDDPSAGSEVIETMSSAGYTYLKVATAEEQVWYAVPECAVAVGDRVTVAPGAMVMRDFESNTLGRTFDVIYFATGMTKAGDPQAATGDAAHVKSAHDAATMTAGAKPAATVEAGAVEKAEGGLTVAEIFAQNAALAGKEVSLRGKVVKWNAGIMGKNWLHVRDGTGAEGTNDITVTTAGEAKIGDTVVVKGKVAINRDFGYGYVYELLIEDAAITVE